ncbi:MAG: hypothetical protein JWQ06_129, partial [Mucilaginibacter sp.]|nr:hypothetical protein [Mucilaginibacter sp.]
MQNDFLYLRKYAVFAVKPALKNYLSIVIYDPEQISFTICSHSLFNA